MCKYDQDINYGSSGTEFIKIFERYRLRSDSKFNCTSQGFFSLQKMWSLFARSQIAHK